MLIIGRPQHFWLTVPGTILIGREIVVSPLARVGAEVNRRGLVAVSRQARVKTTVQLIAMVFLLANDSRGRVIVCAGGQTVAPDRRRSYFAAAALPDWLDGYLARRLVLRHV